VEPFPAWGLVYAFAILRVLAVLILVFVVLPKLVFPPFPDRGSAAIAGRFLIQVFLAVALGHLLAPLRLWEGLVIVGIIALALLWRFYLGKPASVRHAMGRRLAMDALDLIDKVTGRYSTGNAPRHEEKVQEEKSAPIPARLPSVWPELLLLAIVIGVAAWLRFGDQFQHAAPAFSDAPTTLKWLKMFGSNAPELTPATGRLYPPEDGVYPKGMYSFLSVLKKLSAENPMLVIEAAGPLHSTLTVLGIAGVVRWATGSTLAAVMSALLYGTLPGLLPMEFPRQAGYNSQEFAMLFVLPAAWFAFRYLAEGKLWHLLAAVAGAGITLFTHMGVPIFTVAFMGGAAAAAIVTRQTTWGRFVRLAVGGAISFLIALTPMAVALLLFGQKGHSTSVEFLSSVTEVSLYLPPWQPLAVLGLALLAPVTIKQGRPGVWAALLIAVAGVVAWVAPYAVQTIPAMRTVAVRSPEAGALALALAGGLAWFTVEQFLSRWLKSRHLLALLAGVVVAGAWVFMPPALAKPPRVSTDEEIMQMLRVEKGMGSVDWLMVAGPMGYSMAWGDGEHQYPADFVAHARTGAVTWCWETDDGQLVPQPKNVFLFVDKLDPENGALLEAWVEERKDRLPLTQMYAGENLDVWWLKYDLQPDEVKKQLLNEQDDTCNYQS